MLSSNVKFTSSGLAVYSQHFKLEVSFTTLATHANIKHNCAHIAQNKE